ncbi:MAG: hypothetical protein HRT78_09825 [Halomonas sp.]|jgi:hypothetical protein|uniref:hypothetical protein n=1 Tax=Halomonas sp. NyZ770 TaxID=2883106 RepID=UPI001D0AC51E|nr:MULTISPECIES: hypothetical protein [unclassified Halomonas]NQY77408.1 hypothetical protein [Halomonas sp.]UDM07831.1 hypothetical protein LG409_02700 [Halomonas sp. NyZ770]
MLSKIMKSLFRPQKTETTSRLPPGASLEAPTPQPTKQPAHHVFNRRPDDHHDQAFDLATHGIEWSDEAKEKIRPVLFSVLHEGASRAKKALEPLWPEDFNWPEAEAYLTGTKKVVTARDYAELLRLQVSGIAYQLHRIDQIRDLYADEFGRKQRPYLMYRGDGDDEGTTLCGKPENVPMLAEEVMQDWLMPCVMMGCNCKLSTLSKRDMARRDSTPSTP